MNRLRLVLVSLLLAAVVIGGAAYYRYKNPLAVATNPSPASQQATAPTTTQVVKNKPEKGPATQLLDIVRASDPKYPTTQPLDTPLDLRYAARIVLNDPVHLDNQGNLWITRADAPANFNFLKASASPTATHVVRDEVVFVQWAGTDNNLWLPNLVVRDPDGDGYALVDYTGRRPLDDPFGFKWDKALILLAPVGAKSRIVVPTASGVCAFTFDQPPDAILQSHHPLFDPRLAPDRAIQLVFDADGVIAYATSADGARGAKGGGAVARYAPLPAPKGAPTTAREFAWKTLAGWPQSLLHLVPFRDGSVLQISAADHEEKDKVAFSLNTITASVIDEKEVHKLIDDLSSSNPDKRELAFKGLTTFGNGIAPLLEQAIDVATPEAQIRIRQLLKNKIEPTLGSMSLVDGRMRVVNRLPDGGVIFHAEAGVAIPRPDDTPTYVTPAWLSIRPGRPVELLPPGLTTDLTPGKQQIIAWAYNDYVVLDPVMGPQWYLGNRLNPLLGKPHKSFTQFSGIDTTGRWIFREPQTARPQQTTADELFKAIATTNIAGPQPVTAPSSPATTQSTTAQHSGLKTQHSPRTLIIDPRLPDPTPRLPAWQLPSSIGKIGWDKDNWPVIYMDVKPDPVPWALEDGAWRVIDLKKGEKVFTDPAELPKPVAPPTTTTPTTTAPATTSAATTQDSPGPAQDLLLTAPDGTRYFGGNDALRVTRPDGTSVTWPLPGQAAGSGAPTLLRTSDNLLFLFNTPGRIVRIRPTPDDAEPFTLDAVFTRLVPNDPNPIRIWMDPADRICIAHGGNRITVLFPIGRIPPAIVGMMGRDDLPPEDPDAAK
jgi:hypothetical protein